MARVNIEDRAFTDGRLLRFAKLYGCKETEALGILLFLWHDSQAVLAEHGTADEVADWCHEFDEMRRTELISTLKRCRLIEQPNPEIDRFYIKGNGLQIDNLRKFLLVQQENQQKKFAGRSLAGKARCNKAKRLPNGRFAPASDQQPSSKSQQQFNTIQFKEEDISSEGNIANVGQQRLARTPHDHFLNTWLDNCGGLSKPRGLNESRRKKIKARWGEKPDLEYWAEVVRRMAASSFCCEGGWATFDWLITNDTNHMKVMEGKYDNRGENNRSASGGNGGIDWKAFHEKANAISEEESLRHDFWGIRTNMGGV
jgi:hypothetical protein